WPVSVGVVLVVAFAGIGSIESSAAGVQTARAAVQPAMVVGTMSRHGPAALPAVIASVKAELRGDPIPSPLVPSLFDLPGDLFGAPQGCAGANPPGQTRAAICYVSGPAAAPTPTPTAGRKTLVVLGDSHAEMWIRPLLAMAPKDHWDVVPMWKSGCTPAIL